MLQAPAPGCVLVVLECCRLGLVVTTVLHLLLMAALHTAAIHTPLTVNRPDHASHV